MKTQNDITIIHRSLYSDFFKDQIDLFPSLNDSLNLKDYAYLRDQQEDPFSDEQNLKEIELYKSYLNKVKSIKNKNIYDKTLEYICSSYLEYNKYNFDLTPINHQDNYLTFFGEMCQGNSIFILKTAEDYKALLEKIKINP